MLPYVQGIALDLQGIYHLFNFVLVACGDSSDHTSKEHLWNFGHLSLAGFVFVEHLLGRHGEGSQIVPEVQDRNQGFLEYD